MDHDGLSVNCGKQVFVAADNETNLTLMTELLEQDRHQLAIAWSGLQSLELQAPTPARPRARTLRVVAGRIIDPWMVEELKSISANPEFLPELLLDAAKDIDRSSDLLMQALRSGDVERTRVTAHALKGVAASVGANRLAAFAARLMREHPEQQGPALKRMCAELAEVSLISMTALLDIVAGLAHPLPGPRPIPRVARVTSVGQVKQQNG